jgi:hypothetical protein
MVNNLTLTREQVQNFARNNRGAVFMADVASGDYVACRCCLINGLFSGLVLGAQAVEKFLKAYILLKNPSKNMKAFSHKLMDLTREAESLDSNLDLKGFYPLIDRLSQYYQTRYPDNPNQPSSMTTAELIEIDKLIIYINNHLPMPDEVKYRSGIYARLFSSKDRTAADIIWPEEFWLANQNQAISSILIDLEKRYDEVTQHLYPKV